MFRVPVDGAREAALILGELYLRDGRWKFRAVGQGFVGGLKPLSESFGVQIADDAPRSGGSVGQPPLPKMKEKKREQQRLQGLLQKADELAKVQKSTQEEVKLEPLVRDNNVPITIALNSAEENKHAEEEKKTEKPTEIHKENELKLLLSLKMCGNGGFHDHMKRLIMIKEI